MSATPTADAPSEEQTWTFFGFWENDRIVVQFETPGEVDDDREDDGTHEQGLWAASGSGPTMEEAQRLVVAEYEDAEDEDLS